MISESSTLSIRSKLEIFGNRLSIGVDHYLIASCFAYIESFLDQAVTSDGSSGICFKQDLPLGDLALRVSEIIESISIGALHPLLAICRLSRMLRSSPARENAFLPEFEG